MWVWIALPLDDWLVGLGRRAYGTTQLLRDGEEPTAGLRGERGGVFVIVAVAAVAAILSMS